MLGGCLSGSVDEHCATCGLSPALGVRWGHELWSQQPDAAGLWPHQRVAGAIWGHLVGDAVGVPYEFTPAEQIRSVELRGHGTHNQPPATWSDDGALMLALLDSLAARRLDLDDQAHRFLQWADDGAYTPDGDGLFDIGGATSTALANLRRGIAPADAGHTGPRGAGNGSLMRILPIALTDPHATDDDLIVRAHLASRITHADTRCQAACALYVLLVRSLLDEHERDEVLERAISRLADRYARNEEWARELAPALALLLEHRTNVRYGATFVLDSFWSAWDAFAGADDYRATIEHSIRMGHDTDTTAAIAGGLAGTYWGSVALPTDWLDALRGQDIVERLLGPVIAEWADAWRTELAPEENVAE